ncbi:MAG: Membrane-associated zinc metalloprotease, partial [Candidatus Daviesbacteria bacterium GW2011_GWA2_42_7]
MFFTIIVFIITLLVLVVSHEFGHFIAAKKFGIGVLEFGFGLPPRVWGKKWGETLVSLNLLPLGGFVRLMGEDETDKKVLKNKSSFAVKPVWQRIIVVVAGVVMNLVLAAVIFYIVLFAQGFKEQIPLLSPYKFAAVDQINEALVFIGGVTPDAPADKGGIKSGDQVLKFNETKVVSGEQLVSLTKDYVGKEVSLTLKSSESQERVVKVTPRANPPAGQGALGVEIGTATVANLNYETLPQKLFSGFT